MMSLSGIVRATIATVSLALAAAAVPASAQQGASSLPGAATAIASSDGRAIVLDALPPELSAGLAEGRVTAVLRAAASSTAIPVAIDATASGPIAIPRFPVLRGIEQTLEIATAAGPLEIPISFAEADPPPARVAAIWPAAAALPENTLRLYLIFDAPMARGVTEHIHFETPQGDRLDDSFLNLATELWSPDQTRLTLLLDPGRIKRGVGPNAAIGAPLEDGRGYRLVVDPEARDALGRPLATGFSHTFETAPAIRSAIDPWAWAIDVPAPGTTAPLTAAFDRPIDRAIAARAIRVVDAGTGAVSGTVTVADRSWTFVPNAPWTAAPGLRIDPVLEDVAGNTICQPFDVAAGRALPCDDAVLFYP